MKYCEQCSKEVGEFDGHKYHCDACGADYYINPKAATALILINGNDEIVITRRTRQPAKGKLDCLGGFVDLGESLEQAMWREIAEETGLTADDITPIKYYGSSYNDYEWQGRLAPVTVAYFVSKLGPDATINVGDDVEIIETIDLSTPNNVNADDFAWQEMAKIIKDFAKDYPSWQF